MSTWHQFFKNQPNFSLVWGNCAINPILYSFLGYGFKQKLKNAWNKIANNFKCCGGRFRYRTSSGINVSVSSREGSKATFTSYLPNEQTKKFLISGESQNIESQKELNPKYFRRNLQVMGKFKLIITFRYTVNPVSEGIRMMLLTKIRPNLSQAFENCTPPISMSPLV